jgi:hypothetical protein
MRADEEYQSAAVFSAALDAVIAAALPNAIASGLAKIVGEELRHADLCTRLARQFDAAAPRLGTEAVRARVALLAEPRWRAIALLLVEGAIGETISSALLATGRKGTTEPAQRAAFHTILADEVLHARFCWRALAAIEHDRDLEAMQAEATWALGEIEHGQLLPVLRRLEAGAPFDPAWEALGVLRPEKRVEAFYSAVERSVIPRLSSLGLDGDGAWRHRYQRPS